MGGRDGILKARAPSAPIAATLTPISATVTPFVPAHVMGRGRNGLTTPRLSRKRNTIDRITHHCKKITKHCKTRDSFTPQNKKKIDRYKN
jgi:hypothetical protein